MIVDSASTAPRGPFLLWLLVSAGLVLATLAPIALGEPILALLPGLGVMGMLVVFRAPHWLLYGIIFLIPFGNFREIGGIKLHWLLALLLVVITAWRLLSRPDYLRTWRSNLWFWLLLLLAARLLSGLYSDYPATVVEQLVLTLVSMLFFGLTISVPERVRYLTHGIPAAIALSVSLGSALALVGAVFDVSWFTVQAGEEFTRSSGASRDPNNLAMQIIFGLPFVVFWMRYAPTPLLRLGAALLLAINLGAMVVSYSRSGAIVLGLLCAALFWFNVRGLTPRRLGPLLVAGAVALLVAATLVPDRFWDRLASVTETETDHSLGRRSSYLFVARDAFVQSPLIGHGPGTFRDLYAGSEWAERFSKKGSTNRRFAHNTYVEILVGIGLIGLACFGGLLLVTFRNYLLARAVLAREGNQRDADLATNSIIALVFLLLFLLMFSDEFQKFMLLAVALSELWRRLALGELTPESEVRPEPMPAARGPEP